MRVRNTALWFALLASTCLAPLQPSSAGELPTGPSVAHGSVGIALPNANTMTMQQSSATAIVNWQGFSVGAGAAVNIQQPSASSALLNRVTGAATSAIAGSISANGQVYLVNPNGIVITPTGTVRAGGGFVASTLGISDEDFKAGRRTFTGTGSSAAVVNQGSIEVGRGGYAALLGGSVENAGTISVPVGKVGLGAGEKATLDISGDGFLQVAVPSESAGEKALIRHSGRIRANGGRVEMQAATAREVARQAINLTGVVEARTVGGRSGAIVLGGGAGGTVAVSGRLTASATRQARRTEASRTASARAGKGGEITITGDRIQLSGARLDTSGRNGGGSVRIGGDLQGKGTLPHARTTMVDSGTQILADATENGNGGTVILWSDEFTGFGGLIRARGGANGGDGGFAEVSSKGVLGYNGQTILTAARGTFGTLLLDPYNIIISNDPTTTGPSPSFTPGTSNSVINASELQNALATASVTISTDPAGGSGTDAGNITVAAPIVWAQPTILTLNANSDIEIGAAISAPQGGLTLLAGGSIRTSTPITSGPDGEVVITICSPGPCINGSFDVGTLTANAGQSISLGASFNTLTATFNAAQSIALAGPLNAGTAAISAGTTISLAGPITANQLTLNAAGSITPYASVNVGIFSLGSGAWTQSGGPLPAFSATDFRLNGGSFLRVNGGDGDIDTPYVVTDVYGLQGINSLANLGFSYQLANDIDASGTSQWNGGAGFMPIGGQASDNPPYSGTFDGQGHGIRNLTINRPGSSEIGLFGDVSGIVRNAALINAAVIGGSSVGSIAGQNSGTISNVFGSGGVLGRVTGAASSTNFASAIGGLVGTNFGLLSQSTSMAIVDSGPFSQSVGGLVGLNGVSGLESVGTVSQSYLLGSSSFRRVLVGPNSSGVGGLVGTNLGSVSQSYSWGGVEAGASSTAVGGFIGSNSGPVTASFWDIVASGQTLGIGSESAACCSGLTGLTTAQFQDPAFFVPLARGQGWNFETTWAPPSPGFYPELYAMAPVIRVVTGNATRLYGDPNPFFSPTYIGGTASYVFSPEGDTVLLGDTLFSPATPTSPVASYPILGTNVTSTAGVTYRLVVTQTDAALVPTLAVTPAPLTVTASNQSAIYGSPFAFAGTEFSATGLRNGETIGSASLSSAGAATTANVGTYQILAGTAAGGTFSPGNYSITYLPGTLSVTPAPLTLTANNQSAVYGSPFAFAGTEFSATGLRNGETVGTATLSSAGATATASVGGYEILAGNAAGGTFSPGNYSISYLPGTLSVTPAPLIIAANDQLRALGVPFFFTGLEFTAIGLRNGETVGSAALSSAGAAASAPTGLYPIVIGGAAGGSFNPTNYAIAYAPGVMTVGTGAGALARNTQAGVLARQLPVMTINLPNPIDSFDLTGGGSGGGGVGGGGPTLGTGRPGELDAARNSLAAIERSSNDLESKVANCDGQKDLKAYTSCVGDALTQFADALEARTIDLPGPMRGIPAVIRQAARQVRAARTVQEARAAVGVAVAEVRKAIALIRADDPAIGQIRLQQANRIASALGSVETRLSRATGL